MVLDSSNRSEQDISAYWIVEPLVSVWEVGRWSFDGEYPAHRAATIMKLLIEFQGVVKVGGGEPGRHIVGVLMVSRGNVVLDDLLEVLVE